jgi:hypothetical protein
MVCCIDRTSFIKTKIKKPLHRRRCASEAVRYIRSFEPAGRTKSVMVPGLRVNRMFLAGTTQPRHRFAVPKPNPTPRLQEFSGRM